VRLIFFLRIRNTKQNQKKKIQTCIPRHIVLSNNIVTNLERGNRAVTRAGSENDNFIAKQNDKEM
jgi:hypothetical protein